MEGGTFTKLSSLRRKARFGGGKPVEKNIPLTFHKPRIIEFVPSKVVDITIWRLANVLE